MPELMHAAVITAPGTCALREVPVPIPAAGEHLIRVECCGVCGSNLPLWEGRPWFSYPAPPGSPGHEGWGTVVAGPRAGERVAFLSEHAFAEYDVARDLVALPAGLGDVPGEPLGCAMNIFRRSDIRAGQTVAIVGAGFLGQLLVQLATHAGARAIAISHRPSALAAALAGGACAALSLGDDDGTLIEQVEALTGGALCDRAIEVVGLQRPLDLAAKLCKVRGRLVIAGFHQDGPRQIDMFLWNWRGLDVVNAHEREPAAYLAGIAGALDALASGALRPGALYTHRVSLAQTGAALELLRARPAGFAKALVIP